MEGNIQAAAMRIAAAAQPSSLQWPFWPTKRLMPDFLEWLYMDPTTFASNPFEEPISDFMSRLVFV